MSLDTYIKQAHSISKEIDDCLNKKEKEVHQRFLKEMKMHISKICVVCRLNKTKTCEICLSKTNSVAPKLCDFILASDNWELDHLKKKYISSVENTMACIFAVGTPVTYKNEEWTCLYFESNKVLITKDNVDLIVSSHELIEGKRLDADLPLLEDGTWKQKRFAIHNRCAALYFDPDTDHGFKDQKSSIAIITKYKNKYKSKYDKLRLRFSNTAIN